MATWCFKPDVRGFSAASLNRLNIWGEKRLQAFLRADGCIMLKIFRKPLRVHPNRTFLFCSCGGWLIPHTLPQGMRGTSFPVQTELLLPYRRRIQHLLLIHCSVWNWRHLNIFWTQVEVASICDHIPCPLKAKHEPVLCSVKFQTVNIKKDVFFFFFLKLDYYPPQSLLTLTIICSHKLILTESFIFVVVCLLEKRNLMSCKKHLQPVLTCMVSACVDSGIFVFICMFRHQVCLFLMSAVWFNKLRTDLLSAQALRHFHLYLAGNCMGLTNSPFQSHFSACTGLTGCSPVRVRGGEHKEMNHQCKHDPFQRAFNFQRKTGLSSAQGQHVPAVCVDEGLVCFCVDDITVCESIRVLLLK